MKITIDLPKDKDCQRCCCYAEAYSQIGDQKIKFYLCKAFQKMLTVRGLYDVCVDRCQECKDAEIPEL